MAFVFSNTATINLPFIKKKYVGDSFLQHLKHVRKQQTSYYNPADILFVNFSYMTKTGKLVNLNLLAYIRYYDNIILPSNRPPTS